MARSLHISAPSRSCSANCVNGNVAERRDGQPRSVIVVTFGFSLVCSGAFAVTSGCAVRPAAPRGLPQERQPLAAPTPLIARSVSGRAAGKHRSSHRAHDTPVSYRVRSSHSSQHCRPIARARGSKVQRCTAEHDYRLACVVRHAIAAPWRLTFHSYPRLQSTTSSLAMSWWPTT